MTDAAIAIRDLCKTYQGGKRALDGLGETLVRGRTLRGFGLGSSAYIFLCRHKSTYDNFINQRRDAVFFMLC